MLTDLIIGAASGALVTAIPYQFALSLARREAEELRREVEAQVRIVENLIGRSNTLMGECDKLRSELIAAHKNDTRDPKTGRFVKAAPTSSAVQARSYPNVADV